ncbi:MAG: hypothetical protein JW955_06875 [Sedimentisphaerales bacterium]|nr:hypothetical protein [Sedimentisphaerales bacterium]
MLTRASLVLAADAPGNEPNGPVAAQEATKTRTQLLNELSLRTAQVDLEHAREAYERYEAEYKDAQNLFQKGIMSRKELDEAVSAYARAAQQLKQAQIQLEKTRLSFLANATHITIVEAKKYYDNEGRRKLDLVLRNTSNLTQAASALSHQDPNLPSQATWQDPDQIRALLNVENIIVSVVKETASISKPYEEIIPVLPYGQEKKVTFELLTDVEQAGVKLQYLDQTVTNSIYLEKESLQETPTMVASQFSLEGELGTDVRYDLSLEMIATSDRNFSLAVTNVPPQINCFFVDSSSGSRVTSVRFSEEVSKHSLSLRASIPRKLDVGMIDKRIDFQAWVATTAQVDLINKLKRQHPDGAVTDDDLDQIGAGRVDLSLIPKGTGRLEILINNLYTEIKPQEPVLIQADLHNDGTLTLFNIVPEISPPLRWEAEVEPKIIERMQPNEQVSLHIRLRPGADVGVGEYEAQIEARGQSGSETIEALEKRVKVRINAETNIKANLLLVGGLVSLIVVIMVFGVKLSRR